MPVEIERKFLVSGNGWHHGASGQRYCQGYLVATGSAVTVRVRRAGPDAYLTIKGRGDGLVCPEFEYPIPAEDAEALLNGLCRRPLIEKTRHEVVYASHLWHVDVFSGDNEGLVLAEVELERADESVALPPWVGTEVTFDPTHATATRRQ